MIDRVARREPSLDGGEQRARRLAAGLYRRKQLRDDDPDGARVLSIVLEVECAGDLQTGSRIDPQLGVQLLEKTYAWNDPHGEAGRRSLVDDELRRRFEDERMAGQRVDRAPAD